MSVSQPFEIVQPIVGRLGQTLGTVIDIEQDRIERRSTRVLMVAPTSSSRMPTRGSSRQFPKSSAMGPRAHATTAGTSSATVTLGIGAQFREGRAKGEAHAEATDEDRGVRRFERPAGDRRECAFRTRAGCSSARSARA